MNKIVAVPNIPTIGEIQSHAAAQRYALALSGLAAAQDRITALEEALEDAEWLRLQAENLAMTVTYPDEFGQVWHIGTEPPPDEVAALIDLGSGTAWERCQDPTVWRRLGTHSCSIRHEWPIDDAGPFIALPQSFGIHELGKTLDRVIADHVEIRRQISGRKGYYAEGERYWSCPTLHEATSRVLTEMDHEAARRTGQLHQLATDFQAIANHIDDPTIADVWREAAQQVRDALNNEADR